MVSIAEIVNDQKLVTAILEHFRYLTGFWIRLRTD